MTAACADKVSARVARGSLAIGTSVQCSECDSSVQETAGLASPASVTSAAESLMFPTVAFAPVYLFVYLTAAFGMPLCVTASNNWEAGTSSCLRQVSAAFVTAAIANPITWLRFCECSSRNCSVCQSPDPTSNVRKSSEVRSGSVCETGDSNWGRRC